MSALERLRQIFRDIFDDEALNITPETTPDDIEDWDSLAQISIISSAQDEFGVEFDIGEIADITDVGSLLALIDKKTAAL